MAVLFISAELEEVLRLSHKVAVLRDRRLVAELDNDDTPRRRPRHADDRERSRARSADDTVGRLARHRLFWPVGRAGAAAARTSFYRPSFSRRRDAATGTSTAASIDILRLGAPLILVALGMTLVIATGGIDLSVGSVVAISGAIACLLHQRARPTRTAGRRRAHRGRRWRCGLRWCSASGTASWSPCVGIQPIIATLILMVAGRGLAQLITEGQIITINSAPYKLIGGGYWLTLPFAIFIALAACTRSTALLTRRTALGMLIESVGGNAEASRLAGIRSRRVDLPGRTSFCGALRRRSPGLMISSNVSSADGNNAGLWIELDAILAVVIGGTSLAGGRFSLGGTVLGALIIQTLTTTIYSIGIAAGDDAAVQGARRDRRLPDPVAGVPREGRSAGAAAGEAARRRRRPAAGAGIEAPA